MIYHRGREFQRGGGVGSILSGLVKKLIPIAKNSYSIGKEVLKNDVLQNVSRKALEHGTDMAKDLVADVLRGKSFSEAAENQIEKAKKKVSDAISGGGGDTVVRKRKRENVP